MGRWAQRRLAGGGSVFLNTINNASIDNAQTVRLIWKGIVDPTKFSPSMFISNPSGTVPISVTGGTNQQHMFLNFGPDIDTDTSVTYLGAVPGTLAPQTKTYS